MPWAYASSAACNKLGTIAGTKCHAVQNCTWQRQRLRGSHSCQCNMRSCLTGSIKCRPVRHLHSQILVHEQIWRLEVSVHNGRFAAVQVVHAPGNVQSYAYPPLVIQLQSALLPGPACIPPIVWWHDIPLERQRITVHHVQTYKVGETSDRSHGLNVQ